MKAPEIVTFAILFNGRMAERLRQRSAKPSTPVRIRFRPQPKASNLLIISGLLAFFILIRPAFNTVLIMAVTTIEHY